MKISQRTTASDLTGAELVGVIQGGVDKKVAVEEFVRMGLSAGGIYYSSSFVDMDDARGFIGSQPATLIMHTTLGLGGSSVIFPSTLSVVFVRGGQVTIGNQDLTFNGTVDAPAQQVFNYTGSGVVKFGIGAVKMFLPEWWGAIGDNSTDNTVDMQACFTSAGVTAALSGSMIPIVSLTSGAIYKTGNITLPAKVGLDMEGSLLSAVAVGGTYSYGAPLLTILRSATAGVTYTGLAVLGLATAAGFDPQYEETNIGIRFDGSTRTTITLRHIEGFYIGIQMYAASFFCGYSMIHGGFINLNKIGIDLRTGPGGVGWVNELQFKGQSIDGSLSTQAYGAAIGVRFSSADDGQHGQNNNRFDQLSFEMQNHSASFDWTSGASKTQFNRYATSEKYWAFMSATASNGTDAPPATNTVTFSNSGGHILVTHASYSFFNDQLIYFTNSGGALATGLSLGTWYWVVSASGNTHKVSATKGGAPINYTDAGTGTSSVEAQKGTQYTDNASKLWQCDGVKMRCPIYIEDTNCNQCAFTKSRWESGYGPGTRHRVARFPATNQNADNVFEFYDLPTGTSAVLGDLEPEVGISPIHFPIRSIARGYGLVTNPAMETVTIGDMSRRAIISAGGLTIAGMGFVTRNDWNTITQSASVGLASIICKDYLSLKLGSNWMPVVFIDAGKYKRFRVQVDMDATHNYVQFKPYDGNFQSLALDTANKTIVGSSNFLLQSGEGGFINLGGGIDYPVFIAVPNIANIQTRYIAVGLQDNVESKIRSLAISTVPVMGRVSGALRVVTPWGSAEDFRRSSVGIPTSAWLQRAGEIIDNIGTGTNDPLGWVVKTAGALAPAYANGVAVVIGELRSDGTNIKAAVAAHTTNGATMADDVTNGNAWDTQCPIAVVEAILRATKAPEESAIASATFAQHKLTGAQDVVCRNTTTTPGTLTTRTAAEMIADHGGGTSGYWRTRIVNISANTLTVGLGSGVTNPLSTTLTIAGNKFGDFLFVITGAGAVTIARVGTGDHV